MKLKEVLEQIRSSELASLSKSNKTQDVLITCINLGLIELYKRFSISTKSELVRISIHNPIATLNAKDVNLVLDAYDEKGDLMWIKSSVDSGQYDLIKLSYNSFLVKKPRDGKILFVYRAAPELLPANATEDKEILLPYAMLEALLHYVGYRLHNSIGGQTSLENGDLQYRKFERSCDRLIKEGYMVEVENTIPYTVENKGFV